MAVNGVPIQHWSKNTIDQMFCHSFHKCIINTLRGSGKRPVNPSILDYFTHMCLPIFPMSQNSLMN